VDVAGSVEEIEKLAGLRHRAEQGVVTARALFLFVEPDRGPFGMGLVLSTDYTLTARAADFGGLLYGDGIRVDGVNYQVRETRRIDDGALLRLHLASLHLMQQRLAANRVPSAWMICLM
jgi:hypothetical protein